jgi:hypothetical protein
VEIYGIPETRALIAKALAGEMAEKSERKLSRFAKSMRSWDLEKG